MTKSHTEKIKEELLELISKLETKEDEIDKLMKIINSKLQKFFDFEVEITFCKGDGFLILNVDSSDVYTLDCLKLIKKRQLTKNDVFHYSI